MALGDSYTNLSTLKDYLKIKADKINDDDTLTDAIQSVSEEIELICDRQFNLADAPSARLYRPTRNRNHLISTKVYVDDFATTDGLVVEYDSSGNGDWVEISSSQYELYPYNGVVNGQTGWPYNQIHFVNFWLPHLYWNSRTATVRVTARWGWSTVPAAVKQACLIMAAETYQLKDSPYGVQTDQFGLLMRPSSHASGANSVAMAKLSRYMRNKVKVG